MVLTLGIHSRMGTVRGPNVIGICLSTLQGGGSGWCLLSTGKGVGTAPEGDISKARVDKGAHGEGERQGEGFVFSDLSWMIVGIRCLRGWDIFLLLFYREGVLDGAMVWSTHVGGYAEGVGCGTPVCRYSHMSLEFACVPLCPRLHPSSLTLTFVSSLAPRRVEGVRTGQKTGVIL